MNTPKKRSYRTQETASAKAGSTKSEDQPAVKPKKAKPSGPPPALDVEQLTKRYGDITALAPLDLTIGINESVVLVGHNGSGKTTLLRMLVGLLDPTDGTAQIAGAPAGSLEARASVCYLSDQPTFYDDLSVWEHLEYTARLHGVDDWEQRGADLLDAVGLYERADDLPMRFSRGLKQKAAIAIAFIRPFDLLLVDEPFVGLDATGKAALLELLDEAHASGAALVVATHELEFVRRVQRCLALRDGELIYDGSTEGIDVLSLVS